ncbi:hypothetical protein BG95_02250 [Thermosipho sp. 1063]|uniref:hypothetical protein n=1 Tax=unclassified Thermosipho (in: thermotogales) TaxID=2676525 RepID=UPI0009492FB4|nr:MULTISPECIES: hypothetical protein [unclassified Thermosipho (in: thermotogales)]ANQ53339.1 hypothetical protein Y592_02260 [Thermosipho sp. 1070]APT71789.1 hypothetical protein BG95_02250 [Thermosipho sp. 1063]OOC45294.1 hypothetical protein XO08_02240 [Thermosipho sp. 1074]
MKKTVILLMIVSISLFAIEFYGSWNFTFDGTDNSFYSIGIGFPISMNNNTEFGFSMQCLMNSFSFENYGKYIRKTSFGEFAIYGKGGAILGFSLDSLGYVVLAGVRYYFKNFFVSFSYSVLYVKAEKIQTIPIEIGYRF